MVVICAFLILTKTFTTNFIRFIAIVKMLAVRQIRVRTEGWLFWNDYWMLLHWNLFQEIKNCSKRIFWSPLNHIKWGIFWKLMNSDVTIMQWVDWLLDIEIFLIWHDFKKQCKAQISISDLVFATWKLSNCMNQFSELVLNVMSDQNCCNHI